MPTSPNDLELQGGLSWEFFAISAALTIEIYDTNGANPVALDSVASGANKVIELPPGTGESPLYGKRKIKLIGATDYTVTKVTSSGGGGTGSGISAATAAAIAKNEVTSSGAVLNHGNTDFNSAMPAAINQGDEYTLASTWEGHAAGTVVKAKASKTAGVVKEDFTILGGGAASAPVAQAVATKGDIPGDAEDGTLWLVRSAGDFGLWSKNAALPGDGLALEIAGNPSVLEPVPKSVATQAEMDAVGFFRIGSTLYYKHTVGDPPTLISQP